MRNRIKMSLVLVSTGLIFLALCLQICSFSKLHARISKQREMQYFSILFAEDLRRTSNEMTRMARCYIASGDPQYMERFKHTRDVHEGLATRNEEADQSILSIFKEDGICPKPFNGPHAFMEIAGRAGFTDKEYALLEMAKRSSDQVNEVAYAAIREAEANPGSAEHRLKAMNMLVSEEYGAAKDGTVELVHDFQTSVADRTGAVIAKEEKISHRIRYLLIGLGLLFSVVTFGGLLLENRKAERFKDGTRRDALTNLASRGYLNEYLEKATVNAEAHGEIVLLAFIDLNGFKPINDQYGHKKGDELLRLVAKCLQGQCRKSDLVARYGGDEFVIVFVSAMKYRQESIDRMRKSIERAFGEIQRKESGVSVGAAVGISVFPCPAPTVDALIRTADDAMYEAKSYHKKDEVSFSVYGLENCLAYVDRNVVLADHQRAALHGSP